MRALMTLALAFAITPGLAKTQAPKSAGMNPAVPAAASFRFVNQSGGFSIYRIIHSSRSGNDELQRTSSYQPNKSVKIDKRQANQIQNDLVDLSWEIQYRSPHKRGRCESSGVIDVGTSEHAVACRDQAGVTGKLYTMKIRLDELLH